MQLSFGSLGRKDPIVNISGLCYLLVILTKFISDSDSDSDSDWCWVWIQMASAQVLPNSAASSRKQEHLQAGRRRVRLSLDSVSILSWIIIKLSVWNVCLTRNKFNFWALIWSFMKICSDFCDCFETPELSWLQVGNKSFFVNMLVLFIYFIFLLFCCYFSR